ncbi:hypothetical protein [Oscillibacter sp.]|uniref:hypothetical protein n=1 Tax=Oscillibacter sp. TaxID=1945593 RepID=UPI00261DEDB0|nr:hypothetical protein [Oscillibacter sp.]MDD3346844.1 hypothetical protein [Oscillibacter sp.]
MAKNPNNKPKPVQKDEPMNGAMRFFLAGCVAELYLLIIRRFYINGTLTQVVAWDGYLKIFAWVGLAVFAMGAGLSLLWKQDSRKREIGWAVLALGAFVGAVSAAVRLNLSILTLLYVAVPVAILLGILWSLYDRECALALTILGVSLLMLWGCRREISNIYLGGYVKLGAVVYLVALAAVVLLARKADRSGGKLGKVQFLSPETDALPIYVACGLSAAGVVTVLISSMISYYAMWILAGVVFALAVYYTVKQL